MPNIDFYLISAPQPTAKLQFACRLLEKAYKSGQRVYVKTNDAIEMHTLDKLLWIFRDISFIPHDTIEKKYDVAPPIIIGYENSYLATAEVILNLTEQPLTCNNQSQRVLEIITSDANQQIKENKQQFYTTQSYTLTEHDLREKY